jgi:hypothetical protein
MILGTLNPKTPGDTPKSKWKAKHICRQFDLFASTQFFRKKNQTFWFNRVNGQFNPEQQELFVFSQIDNHGYHVAN